MSNGTCKFEGLLVVLGKVNTKLEARKETTVNLAGYSAVPALTALTSSRDDHAFIDKNGSSSWF